MERYINKGKCGSGSQERRRSVSGDSIRSVMSRSSSAMSVSGLSETTSDIDVEPMSDIDAAAGVSDSQLSTQPLEVEEEQEDAGGAIDGVRKLKKYLESLER